MNTTTHWTAEPIPEQFSNGTPTAWRIVDHNGGVIAETNNNTDESHARLIAATPELLAALLGLFEHCAMVHKHWGDHCNQKPAAAAIDAAHAAILKASIIIKDT